jgi:hypothetical protein
MKMVTGQLPDADRHPAISDAEKGAAQREGFTPGPWELSEARGVNGEFWVVGGRYEYFGLVADVTMSGDARLIAAAPDMLDALKQWKWAQDNRDAVEIVNAQISRDLAIAKAEGRS